MSRTALVAVVAVALAFAVLVGGRGGVLGVGDGTSTSSPGGRGGTPSDGQGNRVTNGEGSEVIRQPDGSARTGLPGLRKQDLSRGPLVTTPLPASASRRGAVVDGFPEGVVPVPSGSSVRSSGISSTSKVLQVSLVVNTRRSSGSVLSFYRRSLAGQGFIERPSPAAGGSTALSFTRGADHLVLTVQAGGPGARYSVFGSLRAAAGPDAPAG